MNIILLYGDNLAEIGKRLQKFMDVAKKRGWEIQRIDPIKNILEEVILSPNLFGKERLFVLENPLKLKRNELDWLNKNSQKLEGNLIIVSHSPSSKTLIKSLPKITKSEEFRIPKEIYTLLESIYPGNSKTSLSLFHKVLATEPVELLAFLIFKQIRDLYWVVSDEKSMKYPYWRISKLKSQAKKFDVSNLKLVIGELAEMDILAKSGGRDLISSLDLLLATKLE
ncbi:hypothetical protein HY045_02135 [Candidatus Woesebacteria bacterium]|nr:hypothetical protein [Candidatus Woesebacteria bacterium]